MAVQRLARYRVRRILHGPTTVRCNEKRCAAAAHRNRTTTLVREVPPRPGSYRPENAGPRDNGRGHENVAPHGNGGPHENAPQQERGGHSDRGHEERPRQQKSENNPWAGEEPAQMLFRNGFRKPVAECHEPFSKPGVRADCGSMSVMGMFQQLRRVSSLHSFRGITMFPERYQHAAM